MAEQKKWGPSTTALHAGYSPVPMDMTLFRSFVPPLIQSAVYPLSDHSQCGGTFHHRHADHGDAVCRTDGQVLLTRDEFLLQPAVLQYRRLQRLEAAGRAGDHGNHAESFVVPPDLEKEIGKIAEKVLAAQTN